MKILDKIVNNTELFVESIPKKERKQYGQFFTAHKTAVHMASLFDFDLSKPNVNILDAGAGTGLLSIATIERLLDLNYQGYIHVVCYETDSKVLPILYKNLNSISHNKFSFSIKNENYITSQDFERTNNNEQFDYIIGNPPYLKLQKISNESQSMPQVCHGSPNLYFLFFAMGVYNLKEQGELVYIIPRSWTSGEYFKKFREYLLKHTIISEIHLFKSRDKVFKQDAILQETMIIKVKKTQQKPKHIKVTSSSTSDYTDIQTYLVPYETIVSKNSYVYLITNSQEAEVLNKFSKLKHTLPELELKMKTGLIVDYRTKEVLFNEAAPNAFPIFYSSHLKNGRVVFPIGKEGEYIITDKKSYLQPNGNYLFVKRFTSKEEKRRLQCSIYRQKDFPQYEYISTQNKLNFIYCHSLCILYGLYALLGSTLYDQYYRILNGSTQVNSTEVNTIPMPDRRTIEKIGKDLMTMDINEINCNKVVEKWIN